MGAFFEFPKKRRPIVFARYVCAIKLTYLASYSTLLKRLLLKFHLPIQYSWIMGSKPLMNGYHNPLCLIPNNKSKAWVVQKFGGTSVGKFAELIADDIVKFAPNEYLARMTFLVTKITIRFNIQNNRIAIVCSARSNDTKAEGTTNR